MRDIIIFYLLGFAGSAKERKHLLKHYYNVDLTERTIRDYCNGLMYLGLMQRRWQRRTCRPKRTFGGLHVHHQGYYNYFPTKDGIEERKKLKSKLQLKVFKEK